MTLVERKSINSRNLRTTLIVLFLLLIILNGIGLSVYHFSHQEEGILTQSWNYLSSDLFELITISLLLPIIVLVLESHFRFIQSLLENRHEKEEAIRAERRALAQKQRQERTEKRWEAIISTEKMMKQLFNLAIQVQYFPLDNISKTQSKVKKLSNDRLSTIEEVLKATGDFSIAAANSVNMWSHRLNLSNDDEELFLYLINIVFESTSDIALYIHETKDIVEIAELQAALGIIWNEIKRIAHQQIITFLKLRMEIIEIEENDVPNDRLEYIKEKIHTYRKRLKSFHQYLKGVVNSHLDYLPEISSDEVTVFCEALERARKYLEESQENKFHDFEEKQEIEDLFYKIPRESRFSALNKNYSRETIKHLADALGYQKMLATLIAKAE